jgi:flavin-dependent dehydrogenase
MSDADLIPRGAARLRDVWQTRLAATTFTRERASGTTLDRKLHTVGANTSRLNCATGKNWLAVGDAAMAIDPLSSQGIYNALESGLAAAHTITQSDTDNDALNQYRDWMETKFAKFIQARTYYYAQETRGASSVFWRRRQNISFRKAGRREIPQLA